MSGQIWTVEGQAGQFGRICLMDGGEDCLRAEEAQNRLNGVQKDQTCFYTRLFNIL